MIPLKATYSIALDTRRVKKDNTYPVKLRVFIRNESKRYSTGLDLTEDDFKKSYQELPVTKKHKEIRKQLQELQSQIEEIISSIGYFTFEKFERKLLSKNTTNDLFTYFKLYIEKLRSEDKTKTASSYHQALTSIQSYSRRSTLPFEYVTPKFLNDYEKSMTTQGRSTSTVGIYLRYVRNLFNIAIADEVIHKEFYPFGKGKYVIANTPKTYKALQISDLKALMNEPVSEDSLEAFFRDLWFFSYFGNGINTKDIALLKYQNIKSEIIHFKRAKTILTNRDAPEGEIPMIKEIKTIIQKWGNVDNSPDNYIFPILQPKLNSETIDKRVHQTNKQIRKYIQRIAARAGIEQNISMQHARHTFTTVLVQAGVPLPSISKRLTHGSIATTDKYIGRNSQLKEFEISSLLTLKD